MKKILGVLVILGVVALIAFLAVTRHLAQQRAARLDRALLEAETRVMELESELQASTSAAQAATPASAQPAASNAVTPSVAAPAAEAAPGSRILFAATTGRGITNLVRIEGTSTVHDWQVEGRLIGGTAEFAPGFPGGQSASAVDAKATAFIPVRSLKSVERSGQPYSDAMDEIMYGKLKAAEHKRITFTLTSLKPQAGAAETSAQYEATGELSVAGAAKTITMPVSIKPSLDGKIQITGSVDSKMTDFGITPPSPSVGGMSIKTGDEVKLRFEWWVKPAQR